MRLTVLAVVACVATTNADQKPDTRPIEVDFAPLAKIDGDYGLNYDFHTVLEGSLRGHWRLGDKTVLNIRDTILRELRDEGWEAKGQGVSKIILINHKGRPLQVEKVYFKVSPDKAGQKGPFDPTVKRVEKKS
jgi:hypothetical protein